MPKYFYFLKFYFCFLLVCWPVDQLWWILWIGHFKALIISFRIMRAIDRVIARVGLNSCLNFNSIYPASNFFTQSIIDKVKYRYILFKSPLLHFNVKDSRLCIQLSIRYIHIVLCSVYTKTWYYIVNNL